MFCFVPSSHFVPLVHPLSQKSVKRPRAKYFQPRACTAPTHPGLPPSPPPPSPPPHNYLFRIVSICIVIASAVILQTPLDALSKNLLAENTIFRRYLITDSLAILRYSLPLPTERSNDPEPAPIRLVQEQLERLGVHLRSRGVAGLISSRRDIADLEQLFAEHQLDILLDVPAKNRQTAATKLSLLETTVGAIHDELGDPAPVLGQNFLPPNAIRIQQTLRDAFTPRNSLKQYSNYDAARVELLRTTALNHVSEIEEVAVEGSGPTFRIPRRYNSLPRLLGRAQVVLHVQKNTGEWVDENNLPLGHEACLTVTLDGFSAPLTAGNFVDLVKRGYYDGTRVLATQRSFFAQMGEREDDDADGFIDPRTGTRRQIPLEILAMGEPSPTYGSTLDELGIADLQPTLPMSAFGAVAMVHSVEDANDGSTQFYVFMLEPTSYQARSVGGSILTGSVATFGYVVDGKDLLQQLEKDDRIVSARLISGENNFKSTGET